MHLIFCLLYQNNWRDTKLLKPVFFGIKSNAFPIIYIENGSIRELAASTNLFRRGASEQSSRRTFGKVRVTPCATKRNLAGNRMWTAFGPSVVASE